MKKSVIIVNTYKEESRVLAFQIKKYLESSGILSHIFEYSHKINNDVSIEHCDFVITLGGDGTVLFAARQCAPERIPVFPVNLGEFGFIAPVSPNDWQTSLDAFLEGKMPVAERTMLCSSVMRRDGSGTAETKIFKGLALNDAVIKVCGGGQIARLFVECSGHAFGRFRCDGVIVSTSTGSTAYSAAAGGPIIDPELDTILLNPVSAFSLSNRPIVLGGKNKVFITVQETRNEELMLIMDGQQEQKLQTGDVVCIEKADCKALLAGCTHDVFYNALRSKLNWSGTAF